MGMIISALCLFSILVIAWFLLPATSADASETVSKGHASPVTAPSRSNMHNL